MNESTFQRIRRAAQVTQVAVAVRASVSPGTARAFERHGPTAVIAPEKRARLEAVYADLRRAAKRHCAV